MKAKSTLGFAVAALAAAAVGVAAPANAAQGGNDHSGGSAGQHVWMKVGADELRRHSADSACQEIYELRGNPTGSCNHLVVAIAQQHLAHPNVNGYWAEWYYNTGQTHAGVW